MSHELPFALQPRCRAVLRAMVPLEILEQAGVDRRHFLTDVVGGSIAPLVASDLVERGFAAALHGSYPTAEDWAETVDAYGRDYLTSGAGEIQRRLAADLVLLQQQLGTPRLWAVAATLATLYGKTFPGVDGARVAGWYRWAASFADRSGDRGTRVWVRGRAAIALGYEGACLETAEVLAQQAQDEAVRSLPASLPRFRTHLEMHRGLMLVRTGDREGGAAYARAALDALPAEKRSLTLRMLMTEIERS